MTPYPTLSVLLCALVAGACEKNAVQEISGPPAASRIKFFHFGVGAPGVNFYADETKMTAISSGTGTESNTGVAYGGAGSGAFYIAIVPGQHTLSGRISAAGADKNRAIATVNATIDDEKLYSFYMSGIYNTTAKTVDAFVVEDQLPDNIDFANTYVRFVNAISNASPLTLYGTIRQVVDTTKVDTVIVNAAVTYTSAGTFAALRPGLYNLFARYTDSTTNKVSRTGVAFAAGRVYTIGARGDITVATGTTAPALDNTANR
jgi:hypothetical protein